MKKIYISLFFLLVFAGFTFSQDAPSTGPVPNGTTGKVVPPFTNTNFQFDAVETALAFQTFPTPTVWKTFPIPGYTETTVGPGTFTDFASSGIFAPNGTFFMTTAGDVSGTSQLYRINPATGAATLVANVSGATNTGLNGITYDPTTGIFYVCTGTNIYTIDTNTAVTTSVGPTGIAGGLMIDIAIDCAGIMYGVDLGTDNTYTINKATGTATLLGPLGFNLNFGAGMTYDKINSILYLFGLEGGVNVNALRTINTTTGAATVLHNWVPALSQFAPFDIVGNTCAPPPSGSGLCFNRSGYVQIPDNMTGTGTSTINVDGNAGQLTDITVVIDTVIHTWIGDLVFDLSHGGQTDSLFAWIGTGTFGNSSDNLFGIRLTDSASTQLVSVGSGTPAPGNYLTGGRTGVDSLKKHFVRTPGAPSNAAGNWVLTMHDRAGGDTGSLRAWTLCLYGSLTQIISSNNQVPDKYSLGQNYPNPFNPTTKINFSIPKAGLVSLKVYDMLGREVKTLVSEQLHAGEFVAEFDGAGLSSGTYFYRLQVGDFVQIKKMVLLK